MTSRATIAAAAARLRCTPEAYEANVDAGRSFCSTCRQWLDGDAFHSAMHRSTGANQACRWCRSRANMAKRYCVAMTLAQVRDAREFYACGASSEALAMRYGEPRECLLVAVGVRVALRDDDREWLAAKLGGVKTKRTA